MTMERGGFLKSEFHTADAEAPRFTFEQGPEGLDFVDWQDKPVKVVFDHVVAVRWQDADSTGPKDLDDCPYEILDSELL